MSRAVSLALRTTLEPEIVIGDTRVLAESQAIVLRLPWAAFVWNRPLAVTVVRNGYGQRVQIHRQGTEGVHTMIETETMNGSGSSSAALQVRKQTDEFFDKILAAARPSAVFSAPVVSGEYTVITASEIFAGGGFGFGGGAGPAEHSARPGVEVGEPGMASGSGGGGGGGSHSRPVAAVIIGPKGVKVRPIVDATRIALAVMSAMAGVAFIALRMARGTHRRHHH
jgi:uncharacterized spore protein YtfJ